MIFSKLLFGIVAKNAAPYKIKTNAKIIKHKTASTKPTIEQILPALMLL